MISKRVLAAVLGVGLIAAASTAMILLSKQPWLSIDWSDPVGWARTTPTEDAIAGIAWMLAIALVGYLAVSATLYLVARMTHARRLITSVRRLTIPPVRRAVDTIVAMSVAASSIGGAPAIASPAAADHGAVGATAIAMVYQQDDGEPAGISPPGVNGPGYTPVPAGTPEQPPGPSEVDDDDPDVDPPNSDKPTAIPTAATTSYTVVEGDNLWRIACREMKVRAEIPSLSAITTFWLQLIEANRDVIRSNDPDLIYPGEVLTLPPSGELAP